jgi:hypothetical protein
MSYGPQQPYTSPTPGSFDRPPQKKGWSIGCILGIIALVVGGGGLVCCGGTGGLGWFATNYFLTLVSNEVKNQPVVREHLGEVTACNFDLMATGEVNQEDHFVFNVQGSKGSGVVTVHAQPEGEKVRIVSGNLRMSTGETFNLEPANKF